MLLNIKLQVGREVGACNKLALCVRGGRIFASDSSRDQDAICFQTPPSSDY